VIAALFDVFARGGPATNPNLLPMIAGRIIRNLASQIRLVATGPQRRKQLRQLCRQQKAPLMVSFYHRVADSHPNDWTISREAFRRHVDFCRSHCELIALDELQRRVLAADSPRPTMTFTFDDGYRDNCEFAIPLLLEHKIPCVYFATLDNAINQKPFQHDQTSGVSLAVNTIADLRDMADHGIEIGLHTYSHVDFSRVQTAAVIRREILDAKDQLEQLIGHAVRYFAFPYGMPEQLTQAAIEAIHEAGLAGFCSAYGGYNLPGRDAFHIRRFHGDQEFWRFKNWLSFDQRKVRCEPRVRYFLPPAQSYGETIEQLAQQMCR
jgi:peptidoglycan/xylan/chitin deacetylase (PgdA/CDA1 family)